jgi:hypothetical protein
MKLTANCTELDSLFYALSNYSTGKWSIAILRNCGASGALVACPLMDENWRSEESPTLQEDC